MILKNSEEDKVDICLSIVYSSSSNDENLRSYNYNLNIKFGTKKLIKPIKIGFMSPNESHLPGLNRRPPPYHGGALPTELRRQSIN